MYIYDRRTMKKAAKRDLKETYWKGVLICLIFLAMIFLLVLLSSLAITVALIITGPFAYGICKVFTDNLRKKEMKVETMFEGFKRFGDTFLLGLLYNIYVFLWSILFIVPGIIKSIEYSMAFYIQRDNPDMTAGECLEASKRLTYGNKGKIFCMGLSFMGYIILAILTLGIGTVFLYPYMIATNARMYDYLILNYNEEHSANSQIKEYAEEKESPFEV